MQVNGVLSTLMKMQYPFAISRPNAVCANALFQSSKLRRTHQFINNFKIITLPILFFSAN